MGPFEDALEMAAHLVKPSDDVNTIRHALRVSAEADERDSLIARRNGEYASAEWLRGRAATTRRLYAKMGGQ